MFLFHKGQTIDNRYTVDVTRDRSAVMGAQLYETYSSVSFANLIENTGMSSVFSDIVPFETAQIPIQLQAGSVILRSLVEFCKFLKTQETCRRYRSQQGAINLVELYRTKVGKEMARTSQGLSKAVGILLPYHIYIQEVCDLSNAIKLCLNCRA